MNAALAWACFGLAAIGLPFAMVAMNQMPVDADDPEAHRNSMRQTVCLIGALAFVALAYVISEG